MGSKGAMGDSLVGGRGREGSEKNVWLNKINKKERNINIISEFKPLENVFKRFITLKYRNMCKY